jgi:cytoskeletal protein CcmA (bactofilin family)
MAMFGKTENGGSPVRSGSGGSLSFIGREVTITGNIGGSGNLHIDGTVEGDVAAASLILGGEGHVRGNIVADAAQISGTVDGTVAAKSLVIEATARINGDLSYDAVSVASGAQVEGRVKRLTRDAEPALKLIASE